MRHAALLAFVPLLMLTLGTPEVRGADLTISGAARFTDLDGGPQDGDGVADGVLTVLGNLTITGSLSCSDDGPSAAVACPIEIRTGGHLVIEAGGAVRAEDTAGTGRGGAITLLVGQDLVLRGSSASAPGAILSSSRTTTAPPAAGDAAGTIRVTAGGAIQVGAGARLVANAVNAAAGTITLDARGQVTIDGLVASGPSSDVLGTRLTGYVLGGAKANQQGGAIAIASSCLVEPAVVIAPTGIVVSQGGKLGTGSITIEGCGIEVHGLVAGVTRSKRFDVTLRSGKGLIVDGSDLGSASAPGRRLGRVRADHTVSSSNRPRVRLLAQQGVTILGPAATGTALSAVSANGATGPKAVGGTIEVTSLAGPLMASGQALESVAATGGTIRLAARDAVTLSEAVIRAAGAAGGGSGGGGLVAVRSSSQTVTWTNGTGDVRPVGDGLTGATPGRLTITACGGANLTGTAFPVIGDPVPPFPATTQDCSAGEPSLPSGVAPLPSCADAMVANDDAYTAESGGMLTVPAPGLVANDTGVPPLATAVETRATARGGQVSIDADGGFVYTPPPGSAAGSTDTFEYTVSNLTGSDAATVTITLVDGAPRVVDTWPADGSVTGRDTDVRITFSEPVTLTGNWLRMVCDTTQTWPLSYVAVSGGPTTYTVHPVVRPFAWGETCRVTVVAAAVADRDGDDPPHLMRSDVAFAFTVDEPPRLVVTSPRGFEEHVAAGASLVLTFSEPVDVHGDWFRIDCGRSDRRTVADAAVTGGPTIFTIDPYADLPAGAVCHVIVGDGVTDRDAFDPPDAMELQAFDFTVEAPPAVADTAPADGGVIAPAGSLTIVFSEPVTLSGSWFRIACTASGTRGPAGAVVQGGPLTFSIDPVSDFKGGETCAVTVFGALVADQDTTDPPDHMDADYRFAFVVDAAPAVIATSPTAGETGIAANATVSVTFSEPVDPRGNWFRIACDASGTRQVADTTVTGGPTTFTIDPAADFSPAEGCEVTVFAAQVTDQDLADPPDTPAADVLFRFVVDAAPAVVATVPASGATDQPANTDLRITFSEPVAVTGDWFQIVCTASGTRHAADAVVSGGPTTFTIDPSADFIPGESCSLTVLAGQVADQDTSDPPDTMLANYSGPFGIDSAPRVTSESPADGSTRVGTTAGVTLTFSEPVGVTGDWFQIVCATSGTRHVADTVVTGGPTTFIIVPNAAFAGGEECAVTVVAALVTDQDASDPPDAMLADHVFGFATDVAPAVTSTTPENGSLGALPAQNLTVTFSEPIDATGNWFRIDCATSGTRQVGDTTVIGGPTTFIIDPVADFAAGETCTVTLVATQVSDQDAGDPPDTLAADYVFSFTTDAPPSVIDTTPNDGAVNRRTNISPAITFSEPVDVTGNWFQIVCTTSGTRNVGDTAVTGGPTSFTINPSKNFAAGESCTVRVFAALVVDQDADDPPDTMAADYTFGFTTDAAPAVTTTVPAGGAVRQAIDTNLVITFSENVIPSGNWFEVACTASGTRGVVDAAVSGGPKSFTVNPNSDFAPGESCTATVFAAQVADSDSNDPPNTMAGNHVFGFTLEGPPTVTATLPADGDTRVGTQAGIAVTFSEPVDVTGSWFQIACASTGTRNVSNTVVTGGPTTFAIDPAADFATGESCTLTVFGAQVTDQDTQDPPDAMPADRSVTFTIDVAPAVTATSPVDGAQNATAGQNLTITFSEPVDVAGNWFQIVCTLSGTRNVSDTVVTGGPTTFTINPNTNFSGGDSCTMTVHAAQVADRDAGDPPDTMAADHVIAFASDARPSVTDTTPNNNASNRRININVVVTFSEPVDVTGNWFQIVCATSGTRTVADTVVTGGPTTFTINPNLDFAPAESCTITVFAAQVSDQDLNDPPDTMSSNHVFSFTTDAAPSVSSSTPANGATDMAPNASLTIDFTEPVNVTGSWFQIVCTLSGTRNPGATVVSGGPTSFNIDPNVNFTAAESCTVTVFAARVTDQDANDPPNTMLTDHVFGFTVAPALP